MDNLFGFLGMAYDRESRLVDRFESGDLIVDTCLVTDSEQPYETAISHRAYNDGNWIVVELYDTRKTAQAGHDKWVALMTSDALPTELRDVSSALIAQMGDVFAGEDWRTKPST